MLNLPTTTTPELGRPIRWAQAPGEPWETEISVEPKLADLAEPTLRTISGLFRAAGFVTYGVTDGGTFEALAIRTGVGYLIADTATGRLAVTVLARASFTDGFCLELARIEPNAGVGTDPSSEIGWLLAIAGSMRP